MIPGGFKNMNADQIIKCILSLLLKSEKSLNDKLDRGEYEGTAQDLDNKIETLDKPDAFLINGIINKVGNVVSIAELEFTWRIDLIEYTNTEFSTNIVAATEGYRRIDIIVATKFGTFVKIQGTESVDSAQEPSLPPNTIRLTFFNVFGAEISEPTLPITDISKLDKDGYTGTANTLYESISLEVQNRAYADDDIHARIDGTENSITSLEENKLDVSAYNDRFKGKYTSLVNLQTAYPTANDGDYAVVDSGSGSKAQEYIWDTNEGWVLGTNVGATTTDALLEGSSNLYFTAARVLATLLTGISFTTDGSIVSTDTILIALGKTQAQINTKSNKAGDTFTGPVNVQASSSLTDSSSTPLINLTQTWNTTGTPSAIKLDITDTASNSGSLLLDLSRLGGNVFRVDKFGNTTINGQTIINNNVVVSGGMSTITSGAYFHFSAVKNIVVNSGNAIFIGYNYSPVINHSGAATGTIRGIYLNPNITAAVGGYIALELTNNIGKGIWHTGTAISSFGGRTLIGTTTDNTVDMLQVNGAVLATKYNVKTGANASAGNATLVGGTVTIMTTAANENSIILLTRKISSGTVGYAPTYTTTTRSFTITSDNPLDTSTFSYFIIN